MSYSYETQRGAIFTDAGQRRFLTMRDHCNAMLDVSGAFMMQQAIGKSELTGDVWEIMALVDRLVELGEIREIDQGGCAGQHRLFVRAAR